jgi:hypothetical protein
MTTNIRNLMNTYETDISNIDVKYKDRKLKRINDILENTEKKVKHTIKQLKIELKIMCINNQKNFNYEWAK